MSIALALKDETSEGGVETALTKPEGTKQGCATPAFKVSPLYEGDTSVDLSDPFYSESNINHLLRGIAALNAGKGVEHDLIEDN